MEGFRESGFGEMRPHLFQSSVITKPQGKLDVPVFSATQMAAPMRSPSPHNLSSENGGKRAGMPPSHPNNPGSMSYSQITGSRSNSQQAASPNMKQGPSHSRSLSQPTFFSLDSLPPLSPFSYHEPSVTSLSDPISTDGSMEEKAANSVGRSFPSPVGGGNEFRGGESLPPRKGHRRSNSDTGFSAVMRSSSHLSPVGNVTGFDKFVSGRENLGMERPVQLVKRESEWSNDRFNNREGMCDRKSDGEAMDDLFSAYMNLDNIDALNSSGTEDKDLDSRASGSKTNGGETSDNEVESRANGYPIGTQGTSSDMTKREGVKRRAGTDIAPTVRHYRSVSMDSYMENLQFDDESLKLPLSGKQGGQQSPANSVDASISKVSFEIRSGEFTTAELKKIMENEKLAEIASVDPKRAKRILANRQSAARSKERKMRYISELEHKVQTLQTEATTLSAQVTMLQRDFAGATTENNELKFRVQALEQQARLKDALNEALVSELQRLKLLVGEVSGDSYLSNCLAQQLSISSRISQLQYEQAQLDRLQQHQLQNQQPQQQAPQHQSTQLQTQQPNDDFTSSE